MPPKNFQCLVAGVFTIIALAFPEHAYVKNISMGIVVYFGLLALTPNLD